MKGGGQGEVEPGSGGPGRAELERELAEALDELSKLGPKGPRPDRYHARALLVPLGRLGLEHGAEAAAVHIDRARQVLTPLGPAWVEAVQGELALACAEHVHAVNPRYLSLSNYDFDYTLAARARLAARLWAAGALGIEAPEELARGVERRRSAAGGLPVRGDLAPARTPFSGPEVAGPEEANPRRPR